MLHYYPDGHYNSSPACGQLALFLIKVSPFPCSDEFYSRGLTCHNAPVLHTGVPLSKDIMTPSRPLRGKLMLKNNNIYQCLFSGPALPTVNSPSEATRAHMDSSRVQCMAGGKPPTLTDLGEWDLCSLASSGGWRWLDPGRPLLMPHLPM